VDDQSKKRHVTRFLDSERTKQFWRAVDEYADRTKSWDDYKDVIYESYPGARKGTRYSVIQLQNMSALNAQLPTKTHGDVMEWFRRFKPAATYLRAEGHISQQEANRYFFNGLPEATQQAIKNYLILNRKETKYDAKGASKLLFSDEAYDANPDEDRWERSIARLKAKTQAVKLRAPSPMKPREDSSDEEDVKSSSDEELFEVKETKKEKKAHAELITLVPVMAEHIPPPRVMESVVTAAVPAQPLPAPGPYHPQPQADTYYTAPQG
ncbi:hypothetical protein HDZ31DRAFT_79022, partial [Schizophyllum fasciatum]